MNKLFNTLKNVFKIDSDLSFGDSFHVTGAPRREIVASSEGVPCYVTIGSCLGDGSNQLIDGAISRNANKLLQLASDLYECVDSDDVESVCISTMYAYDFKATNYRLCIGYDCFDYDNIDLLIDGVKNKIDELG